MTNETTENFIKAWSEFVWPEPVAPSYRLYYNDDGTPKCYTMEELPGKYINVDSMTYALRPWNVLVVEEKIKYIQPQIRVQKLQPNSSSGVPCDPRDICVVVSEHQPHTKWNKTTNEIS